MRNCTAWGKTLNVSGLSNLSYLGLEGSGIETLIAHQTPILQYDYNWPVKTVDFSNKGWEGGMYHIIGPQRWDSSTNSWVIDDCPLENLDLSGNSQLLSLDIRNFKNLKSVNLDGATALYRLEIYDNNALANLDLSPVTALSELICYNNALLNLDLSQNTQMNYWYDSDIPQHPKMELVTISTCLPSI